MERHALVWRYGIWIIAFECVVGVALLIGVRSLVLQAHTQAVASAAELTAIGLANRYADLTPETGHDLESETLADAAQSKMRVMVIRTDGAVIADSRRRYTDTMIDPTLPEVLAGFEHGAGVDTRQSMIFDMQAAHAAVRMTDGSLVHVTAPLDIKPVGWRPVTMIAVLWALFVALTAGLMWLLSRRASTTIDAVAERVGEMIDGTPMTEPLPPELASVDRAIRKTRRKMTHQLQTMNTRRQEAETILGSMADGVIALDDQQIILSMNPAAERVLGVSALEFRNRLLQEAALQPSLNAFVRRALHSDTEIAEELEFTGDSPVRVQASASPFELDDSRTGVLLVLTDVTQLRRLERIRSDFASNVSHELRTPITNIKGYVETLIQAGFDDKNQAEDFLHIILRNSTRLGAIVDDIMALTRIEQSEQVGAMEMHHAAILPVIQSACDEQAPEARAKRTEIEIQVPPDLEAPMNPDLMEQAVSNLLSNAVRYTKPGTHVLIRASVETTDVDQVLRIDVQDAGPGIAPEHLPRLFERFYRVDKARSRGVGGTGLGLAIVKHITQVHSGKVEVKSKPGEGSTFSILLPMNRVPLPPADSPTATR